MPQGRVQMTQDKYARGTECGTKFRLTSERSHSTMSDSLLFIKKTRDCLDISKKITIFVGKKRDGGPRRT